MNFSYQDLFKRQVFMINELKVEEAVYELIAQIKESLQRFLLRLLVFQCFLSAAILYSDKQKWLFFQTLYL